MTKLFAKTVKSKEVFYWEHNLLTATPVFYVIWDFFCNFVSLNHRHMLINHHNLAMNRIKAVLAEKQLTARWLAAELGKTENTVSRWCSNKVQPSLPQLYSIAKILNVDVHCLIANNKYAVEEQKN